MNDDQAKNENWLKITIYYLVYIDILINI